jgi:hypothetical protein
MDEKSNGFLRLGGGSPSGHRVSPHRTHQRAAADTAVPQRHFREHNQ